jgi:hypothetical protein
MSYGRRSRVVAVALALGLTAAACGASAGKSSPKITTASNASSPTSTNAKVTTTTVDQTGLAMKAALLRQSDVPNSWKDSGASSASATSRAQIALAKSIPFCRGFTRTAQQENRQVKLSSNKFVDATAAPDVQGEVSNDVVAWPTVAAAKAAYSTYSAAGMRACLDALFRKVISSQSAGTGLEVKVSVENLPVSAAGDASIGYEAVVSIVAGPTHQQLGFIVQIVRSGRYTVSYNATLYKAAPTDFGKHLVSRSIARLESVPSR